MSSKPASAASADLLARPIARLRHALIEPAAGLAAPDLRRKARLLALVQLALLAIFVTVDLIRGSTVAGYRPPWPGYIFLALAYGLNRTSYYRSAAVLTSAMFPLVIFSTIIRNPAHGLSHTVNYLVLSVFFLSIFGTWRAVMGLGALNLLGLLLLPALRGPRLIAFDQIVTPLGANAIGLALALLFLWHRDQVERDRRTELSSSEENLRIALDAARMGTWLWRVGADRVYWSDRAVAIFGLAPGEFRGTRMAYLSLVHPDDLAQVERVIQEAITSAQSDYHIIHRIVWPDQTVRWIEATGRIYRDDMRRPTHLAGTVLDITERRQAEDERARAEAALAASEERYRAISELVSDYAFAYAIRSDGTVELEWVTDAMVRITGYSQAEMQDMGRWEENTYPDDMPIARRRRDRLHAGEPDVSEYRIFSKDGRVLWLRYYSRPVWDAAERRVVRVYGAVQDLTQIKQLELQLNQAQRMEAIGRLAGGVAHDFNNLLTVILGNTELLLDTPADSAAMREDVAQIQRAGERAAALTRQLLAFSRQQVLEPRILSLNAVVSDMSQLLRRLIGEDIEFDTRLDPALGLVRADPGQIEQVIMNMAVNARDAMPGGGTLTIATSNAHLDRPERGDQGGAAAGDYVVLTIQDTGTGMDAATRARIFDPFFTTKPVGMGTGLGLATVHGIVTQSGGYIEVRSAPGQGSTFQVYLPRVEASEPAGSLSAPRRHVPPGSATVLLAEDETMLRMLAARVLRRQGHLVLEAEDGASALRLAAEHAQPIHLLLTDLVMPGGINGQALAARLAEQYEGLKVLFMSGYADTLSAAPEHEPGYAYIQKPFTPDALTRKVDELLRD
jgi:PAS domain S-box-containing protein